MNLSDFYSKIKLADLIDSTLRKKVQILKQKRDRNLALYIKRDVQKCVRDIISADDRKKQKFVMVQKSWLSCIALFQTMNRIAKVIAAFKQAEEERMKKIMVVTNLLRKVRSRQRPKGTDIEERIMLDIRLYVSFNRACLNYILAPWSSLQGYVKVMEQVKQKTHCQSSARI